MPWAAPIIGYSDNLGYLRCSECASEDQRQHAVSGESYFGSDDVCDRCGWRFIHIKSSEYVEVACGYPAPDLRRPRKTAA